MNAIRLEKDTSRALIVLALAYFVQATAGLSVVGGLGAIGMEWQLSDTQSALLMTAFGVTFALSAPLLQMIVGHWRRRTQLLSGMLVLAAGTLLFALSPNYTVLVVSRIIMGFGSALIGPLLGAMGSSLVPRSHQGMAIATIMMGLSIAAVIGVPGSAWIANHLGARWMAMTIFAGTLVVASLIAVLVRDRQFGEKVDSQTLLGLLTKPSTVSAFLVVGVFSTAVFTTLTMITVIMRSSYLASPSDISLGLLIYGIAGISGNFFVRKASMRWSAEVLLTRAILAMIVIFASIIVLPKSLTILFAILASWALAADFFWPSQQRRVVELEPAYPGLGLALTASFMFVGIALGSALGGLVFPSAGVLGTVSLSIFLFAVSFALLRLSMKWAQKPFNDVLEDADEVKISLIPSK